MRLGLRFAAANTIKAVIDALHSATHPGCVVWRVKYQRGGEIDQGLG